MASVLIKNLYKSFGPVEVLHDINLDLADGDFTVFVGPSGCGKTTLLRLICGLEEITSGEMYIDSEFVNDVPAAKRGIAMVFQSYALYPHMTVAQNMGYSLRLAKYPKNQIQERVERAAGILQIDHLLDRKPGQLSGGQRQRVAIGRAIVREPKVFLFDEPLSNLDAALRVEMRVEIAKLRNDLGATMVYVTHDQTEAMTMADRIVVLREGWVEQVGSPLELYHHPQNKFVAGFIGSPKMNFIGSSFGGAKDDQSKVELPGGAEILLPVRPEGLEPGAPVELGIRPEHLIEGGQGGDAALSGQVFVVEHLGGTTLAHVRVPECRARLMVQTGGESPLRIGDEISLGVTAADCHLFNQDGAALSGPGPGA